MKKKILGLIEIADTETKTFILERLKKINDYVYSVLQMEMSLAILSDVLDISEYAKKRNELDVERHNKHNIAIDSVKQLNRICQINDYPLLYEGDNTRRDIADFCFAIVESFYKERL